MKVCFFNVTATSIAGGLETYCWEAGRALARRGHEVDIVAGDRGKAWHNEVRLFQFPYRAEVEWPDFGRRFRRLMERVSFARHAMGHLLVAGYDAIIVNKPFDFPVLWRARAMGLRAQTVFRSGGTDFFFGDRGFAGSVDHWVSTSRHNAREVEERYGRPVRVIYNGVDPAVFQPLARQPGWRSAQAIPDRALVLASVGRLVGLKGLRVVIEALAGVDAEVHFIVMGDGPEGAALKLRAAQLGVGARVHFLGRVARERLPQLLAEADALVQPSIGVEAFGISVVEAMACALPVLASNLGGMRETVIDQQTGRLLAQGEVPIWRDAIAAAAVQRDLLKAWGSAGRERAVSEFSWAHNAARLEALLTPGAQGIG